MIAVIDYRAGNLTSATTHLSTNYKPTKSIWYIFGIYRLGGDLVAQTAKIFKNGRSQAVRLPSDFRFSGTEVNIRRDPETGDVVLSQKSKGLENFFKLQEEIGPGEADFLQERDRSLPPTRELF
jgi:antitoxin VapB